MIRKVWKKQSTGQLMVTLEKDSDIKEGDYVRIIKVPANFDKAKDGENKVDRT